MSKALSLFIPNDFEENTIQKRIIKTFGEKHSENFNALDNVYYDTGKRFFNQAGVNWEKLSRSDYGKMFTLSLEEEKEVMKELYKIYHN